MSLDEKYAEFTDDLELEKFLNEQG